MWWKIISTHTEVHKEKKARRGAQVKPWHGYYPRRHQPLSGSSPHMGRNRVGEPQKPPQSNVASWWPLQRQQQGIASPNTHQWDKITQNISPGHLTNGGITVWGMGHFTGCRGRASWVCTRFLGCFVKEIRAGKGRNQGGLGRRKHGNSGERGQKGLM